MMSGFFDLQQYVAYLTGLVYLHKYKFVHLLDQCGSVRNGVDRIGKPGRYAVRLFCKEPFLVLAFH
jgi:hypothetical protein